MADERNYMNQTQNQTVGLFQEETTNVNFSQEELEKALEEFILTGKIEKEYELQLGEKKIKIVFQTLTLKQLEEISKIYQDPNIFNTPLIALQIPILKLMLVNAIKEFNGKPITMEIIENWPTQFAEEIRKLWLNFNQFCQAVFTQKKS